MSSATIVSDCESGGCVQQSSTGTSNVPLPPNNTTTAEITGRRRGSRKSSTGTSDVSLPPNNTTTAEITGRRRGSRKSSTGTSDVPLPPNNTTTAEITGRRRGSRNSSPGTSDVPLPPNNTTTAEITGRCQGSRKRSRVNTRSPNADGEPGTGEANTKPTRRRKKPPNKVIKADLTPAERAIPGTPLLRDLGMHPSAYARAGRGPPSQNLNVRGAWPTAQILYQEANDQYKELFAAAGFEDFLKIVPIQLPVSYFVALTERWFSETNSLHLPCCEIGPTPVDWTMVTGLRFKGRCIRFSPMYERSRALELLGVGPDAITDGKIRLSKITPTMDEVRNVPQTDEEKERIFRRLFLYVVGSCFFSNNRSLIDCELVQFLENINKVGCYDWGAITYAAFLTGMRRKVTGEIGALTAFWQFLLYWAFEYLDIARPEHTEEDVFPRAMRWNDPPSLSTIDSSEFFFTRCQLDYVDEAQVTWQPYLTSAVYSSAYINSTIALAKRRVPFQSIKTWEYYLGERFRRQLGLTCLVPLPPPEEMHGTDKDCPEDEIGIGKSAESLVMDETVEYTSWFATNSIGRIVNVNRSIGGLDIGGKVFDDWMAKHKPDMILIPQSEYKEITEARDAAVAKCAKLREELVLMSEQQLIEDDGLGSV